MPVNGERLDELISGYLDGCLNAAESAELEIAMRDSAVAERLAELQKLRLGLVSVRNARRSAATGLPANFSAKVWDRIQEQQVKAARPAGDSASQLAQADGSPAASRKRNERWLWVTVSLTACSVLLLLAIQQFSQTDPQIAQTPLPTPAEVEPPEIELAAGERDGGTPPADLLAAEPNEESKPAAGRLTNQGKQWENQLMFTLVVDMQLTREAVEGNYLDDALGSQGIPFDLPVIADAATLAVLSEARMTEQVAAGDQANESVLLYFVHADAMKIDRLVDGFIKDQANVPVLRTDLAFDTPVNNLMQRLVMNAGSDLEFDETFAAQIQPEGPSAGISLAGIGPQGKLVARSSRSRGESKSAEVVTQLGAKSTVLLLVRLPK